MNDSDRERAKEQFEVVRENRMIFEWWEKRFREMNQAVNGTYHTLNLAMADFQRTQQENRELRDRCEQLETERAEAFAAIGELQERVDKMAEWMNKQRGIKK